MDPATDARGAQRAHTQGCVHRCGLSHRPAMGGPKVGGQEREGVPGIERTKLRFHNVLHRLHHKNRSDWHVRMYIRVLVLRPYIDRWHGATTPGLLSTGVLALQLDERLHIQLHW